MQTTCGYESSNREENPESLKFIWGVQAIVGGTEEEALQKQQALNDRVPVEGGLAMLSGHTNHDLSQYDLDQPVEDIEVEGVRGLFEIFTKMYKSGDLGRVNSPCVKSAKSTVQLSAARK